MPVSDSPSNRVTYALAVAKTLGVRFGLVYVRVWIQEPGQSLRLAATAGGAPGEFAGLTLEAVTRALERGGPTLEAFASNDPRSCDDSRFSAPPPGRAFAGFPLRTDRGEPFGYIEGYFSEVIDFARASDVEACIADVRPGFLTTFQTAPRGLILLADNEETSRTQLRETLFAANFRVIEVTTGRAAVERGTAELPDLILMTWTMPGLGGLGATRRLKADARAKAIPIVLIGAGTDAHRRTEALNAGALDILSTPVDGPELVRRIEHFLRWRKVRARDFSARSDVITSAIESNGTVSQAVAAAQLGNLDESLRLFVAEAEHCERAGRYALAARAYRGATAVATDLRDDNLANKYTRLTGKMYLCLAETTEDPNVLENAYVEAARCFLKAGNRTLVDKSMNMITSFATTKETG